jgi:hypothetical protein
MRPADYAELKALCQTLLAERERRAAQCTGKFAFDSRVDARKAIRGDNRNVMEPYRCACGKWHVGGQQHQRLVSKAKRRIRERLLCKSKACVDLPPA